MVGDLAAFAGGVLGSSLDPFLFLPAVAAGATLRRWLVVAAVACAVGVGVTLLAAALGTGGERYLAARIVGALLIASAAWGVRAWQLARASDPKRT